MYKKTIFSIAAIIIFSVIAVSGLIWITYFSNSAATQASNVNLLDDLNAFLNLSSSIAIICGLYFIRNKNLKLHKRSMLVAFFCSSLFLISYLTYHYLHGETAYQNTGFIRWVYFFILISHILLSILALPIILTTFYLALSNKITLHKKLARFTAPVWLYVSVSGVLVYVLLNFS